MREIGHGDMCGVKTMSTNKRGKLEGANNVHSGKASVGLNDGAETSRKRSRTVKR